MSQWHALNDTENLTIGQRLADKITQFAGSWTFICSFLFFLCFWILLNSEKFFAEVFDPFPFILLNLFLSCLAAIQAPVILMSNNRQAEKDSENLLHDIELDAQALELTKAMDKRLQRLEDKFDSVFKKQD